jgi:superfamily II DNA or RNA helicase
MRFELPPSNNTKVESLEIFNKNAGKTRILDLQNQVVDLVEKIEGFEPIDRFRNGQFTVFQDIKSFIQNGGRTGYISLPTGAGKTFIFSQIVDGLIGKSNSKALILTNRRLLLGQIEIDFGKFTDHSVGLVGDGNKDYSKQITICTYNSFLQDIKSGTINLLDYPVLVLDEAHKSLGSETSTKITEGISNGSIVLGFTATEAYSEEKSLEKLLENEISRISIPDAVLKYGMISPIQVVYGNTEITIPDRAEGEKLDEYEQRIGKQIIQGGGNQAAVSLYNEIVSQTGAGKYIMKCITVEQARNLRKLFISNGTKAEVVTGQTKTEERDEIFARFKSGETQVLISVNVLTEGFSEDTIDGALVAYPIGSQVDLIQFGGRSTRLDEDNPDKIAIIAQLIFPGKKDQQLYGRIISGMQLLPPGKTALYIPPMNNKPKEKSNFGEVSVIVTMEEAESLIPRETEKAPKGALSISQIAENIFGYSKSATKQKIIDAASKLGIVIENFIFGSITAQGIRNPADIQKLLEYLPVVQRDTEFDKAPEGAQLISNISRSIFGYSTPKTTTEIINAASELGVKVERLKFRNQPDLGIRNPEDIEKIIRHLQESIIEKAPEEALSITAIAKILYNDSTPTTRQSIIDVAKELDIKVETFKFGQQPAQGIRNPADIQKILQRIPKRKKLSDFEIAPEGALSVGVIATRLFGSSKVRTRNRIINTAKELGIEIETFVFYNQTALGIRKPEDIQRIIAHEKNNK